jgi:hypothetical protein
MSLISLLQFIFHAANFMLQLVNFRQNFTRFSQFSYFRSIRCFLNIRQQLPKTLNFDQLRLSIHSLDDQLRLCVFERLQAHSVKQDQHHVFQWDVRSRGGPVAQWIWYDAPINEVAYNGGKLWVFTGDGTAAQIAITEKRSPLIWRTDLVFQLTDLRRSFRLAMGSSSTLRRSAPNGSVSTVRETVFLYRLTVRRIGLNH